jgi:hypothetical protein
MLVIARHLSKLVEREPVSYINYDDFTQPNDYIRLNSDFLATFWRVCYY